MSDLSDAFSIAINCATTKYPETRFCFRNSLFEIRNSVRVSDSPPLLVSIFPFLEEVGQTFRFAIVCLTKELEQQTVVRFVVI